MHLGNARTALLAWLQIRQLGGRLLLRIEDVDQSRARAFAYDSLRQDLSWLGLDWDQECVQSQRLGRYQAALGRLDTYTCACSRKDIQQAASAPHGKEALYPGTCRQGPSRQNRPLALRWRTPDRLIEVEDVRLGRLKVQLQDTDGDIVLRRNDGCYAYHLAVVVDDGLMGVTHVLRGEDLWQATPIQVALQEALGFTRPSYLHVPLMRDYRGQRLAKRDGAPSVAALRQQGKAPARILAELAQSLGWHTDTEVTAAELLQMYGSQVVLGRLDQKTELSPAPSA